MNVNKDLIKHISSLARLNLNEEEIRKFINQFNDILNAFSKIQEIDTKNIRPSFQPIHIEPHTREDIPKKGLSAEEALALTEHKKGNYFKATKVI